MRDLQSASDGGFVRLGIVLLSGTWTFSVLLVIIVWWSESVRNTSLNRLGMAA